MDDPSWYQTAIENGASYLVVVALFVVALGMMLRSHSKAQKDTNDTIKETARVGARGLYEVSKSVLSLSRQTRRLGEGQAATLQAISAQPARYALEKHRAINGGWTPAELAERRRRVDAADQALESAASWATEDTVDGSDPLETIEERIERLRVEADISSNTERADELRQRAAMLEAELTAG